MKYDKGTFIVVPHQASVLGVGGMAQALFMWLCHYAGKDGDCFPSRTTLAENLHCSVRSVDDYLKELIDVGLVVKEHRFSGNEHTTNLYSIPLWGANSARGSANSAPPVAQNLRTELNPVLTQSTYSGISKEMRVVEVDSEDEEKAPRKRTDTTYLKVFELWGKYPLNWRSNRTEIQAAKNLLEEHGLEDCAKALRFYAKHKHEEMCPQILKPSDLDRKRANLLAYNNKV